VQAPVRVKVCDWPACIRAGEMTATVAAAPIISKKTRVVRIVTLQGGQTGFFVASLSLLLLL
ncbi:MAG: hypothetical protein ACREAC_18760, partial [Blastocatellia bacterium]